MVELSTLSLPSWAVIDIWHSYTVWANQGMCAVAFTLDGGGSDGSARGIGLLEIAVDVLAKSGKRLDSDTLKVEPFSDSEATRYREHER